jgi:hypothetical protein
VSTGICAACARTIRKGDQFVLAGTECFHRNCVGTTETALTRAERSAREATDLAAQAASRAERAVIAGERLAERVKQLIDEASARAAELAMTKMQLAGLREKADRAERLQREVDSIKADRDRIQRELDLARALALDLSQAAPSGPATNPDAGDPVDPAMKRGQLLELD